MFGLSPTNHERVPVMTVDYAHAVMQEHMGCPLPICPVKRQAKARLVEDHRRVPARPTAYGVLMDHPAAAIATTAPVHEKPAALGCLDSELSGHHQDWDERRIRSTAAELGHELIDLVVLDGAAECRSALLMATVGDRHVNSVIVPTLEHLGRSFDLLRQVCQIVSVNPHATYVDGELPQRNSGETVIPAPINPLFCFPTIDDAPTLERFADALRHWRPDQARSVDGGSPSGP